MIMWLIIKWGGPFFHCVYKFNWADVLVRVHAFPHQPTRAYSVKYHWSDVGGWSNYITYCEG
jgi:hypothetical protein